MRAIFKPKKALSRCKADKNAPVFVWFANVKASPIILIYLKCLAFTLNANCQN